MTAGRPGPAPVRAGTARRAFLATLACWFVFPFVQVQVAQDAVPYLVAGEVAHDRPDLVYAAIGGDLFTLEPEFAARYCALSPAGTDCERFNVAYVSTPLALGPSWLLARLGADAGALVFRLGAVACLAGGMLALWSRLAHRRRRAPAMLALSALLLTPSVMAPVSLGQTSPLVFLTICLGAAAATPRRRAGTSLAWVLAGATKLYPFALGALAARHGRWRFLGWALSWTGLLLAGALALGPPELFGEFLRSTDELSGVNVTNPYNGSLGALGALVWPATATAGPAARIFLGVRVVLLAALGIWRFRRASLDAQWAAAALGLLAVTPFVWSHYLWAVFGAVAVVVAERADLDDRRLAVVPVTAALLVPIAIPNARGWSMPIPQALLLVAALVAVAVLVEPAARPAEPDLLPSAP